MQFVLLILFSLAAPFFTAQGCFCLGYELGITIDEKDHPTVCSKTAEITPSYKKVWKQLLVDRKKYDRKPHGEA